MPALLLDPFRALLLLWKCLRWGLPHLLRRLAGADPGDRDAGHRLRRICEEMGVSYVKLGQYLAIRYDLLPTAICQELSNLLNEVTPLPFERVRKAVERELGCPLENRFQRFAPDPVGAASIAQVHRAVALDGQVLAVKVQRPSVEAILNADLRNLRRMAWVADRLRLLGAISLGEVVREVSEFTLREVDFLQEGRMADQIRRHAPPWTKVPQIRWDLTTPRLLAMEFIEGVSLLRVCELAEATGDDAFARLLPGIDPDALVSNLANACLSQLFVTGLFHGDPHPANFIIGSDGSIAFIDFGIFGRLDAGQREQMAELMAAMSAGQHERAFRCYQTLTQVTDDTDPQLYRRDMLAMLSKWHAVVTDPQAPMADKLSAGFQTQVLQLMRRHRVRTEPDQILFWRTLGWLDALAHRLPGNFDMLMVMRRFFATRFPSPVQRLQQLTGDPERLVDAASAIAELPALTAAWGGRLGELASRRGPRTRLAVTRDRAEPDRRLGPLVLTMVALALLILAAARARPAGPQPGPEREPRGHDLVQLRETQP